MDKIAIKPLIKDLIECYLQRSVRHTSHKIDSLDQLVDEIASVFTCPVCSKNLTLVPHDFPLVSFKKLVEGAKMPERAHGNDVGYDLYSLHTIDLLPHELTEVTTGIALACPDSVYFTTEAKSTFNKEKVFTKRGIFDSGYRGEVSVFMQNEGDEMITIHRWQKFAQIVFHPRVTVHLAVTKELPESTRGEGRFGSTGRYPSDLGS